jgi:rRNA processing protein Gar1
VAQAIRQLEIGAQIEALIGPADKSYVKIEEFAARNKMSKKVASDALKAYRFAKSIRDDENSANTRTTAL